MKIGQLAFFIFLSQLIANFSNAQDWQVQPVALQTRWTKLVSPSNALPEYPRPQLLRSNWANLNGLWEYAITKIDAAAPAAFDGKILVPYPLESPLSGVKKILQPEQCLWYKRSFNHTKGKGKTILHFGAVDYKATVFINEVEVGSHEGGYTEFSFDITPLLKSGINEIKVKVIDPSDRGVGPHGKQVLNPQGIYYTPCSGIWQTVWMETVPDDFISGLHIVPDIDNKLVDLVVQAQHGLTVDISILDNGRTVMTAKGTANKAIQLPIFDPKLWSPAHPFLYDLVISMGKDKVQSYFGMRKIAVNKDAQGFDRIELNNQPYYNLGTLDQGFWPDGIYTAPTDEALAFDIKAIKSMGFNTIRKHIKVEPARWYYHADKIGILVWQDMVDPNQGLPEGSKLAFERDAAATIEQLRNNPSIVLWTLFNEKWGQYDQERLTEWIKKKDPSRLVNGHSGEYLYVNEKLRSPSPNAYVAADITDVHSYPDPMNAIRMDMKARVCGEFGGIGTFIADHQWNTNSAWGYITEKPASLATKYKVMNQHLYLLSKEGLSGSIYTQPFDVEGEQNGLMTYDREIIKIPFADLRKIHATLNPDANTNLPIPVVARNADLSDPAQTYAAAVNEYINGKKDIPFLKRLAMMAGQNNDQAGKARFGQEYIQGIHPPYSESDQAFIEDMTKKVTDKGFVMLLDKSKTDRAAYVKAMNIIYADLISLQVSAGDKQPDWSAIETTIKSYGLPGEEIFLRAKTIQALNQKDWTVFKPTAKTYLEKFGANIKPEEKAAFQKAIDEN